MFKKHFVLHGLVAVAALAVACTPKPSDCADDKSCVAADTTAPETTASAPAGSYRVLPVITLTANEAATIHYTVDGSEPAAGGAATTSGESPVTVTGAEGSFTLRFFAVDAAGNKESVKALEYVVDDAVDAGVEGFTATASAKNAEPKIHLAWNAPTSDDVTGVLVVRRASAAVAELPEAGTTYQAGDSIGAGEVVYVGSGTAFEDADVESWKFFHYAAFAFDALGNYAAPALAHAMPETAKGTITIPADGGALQVSPDLADGPIRISGTATVDEGQLIVEVTFEHQAERILFNPKLVVQNEPEGVTLDNVDGTLGGKPYFYFGPDGVVAGEETTRTWLLTADGDVTLEVALETHPLVLMSGNEGIIALFDSGTMKHVHSLETATEFVDRNTQVSHNAVTPDGRRAFFSAPRRNRFLSLDLDTLEFTDLTLVEGKEYLDRVASSGGLVVSPDGRRLFVSGSRLVTDDSGDEPVSHWEQFLFVYGIENGAFEELARIKLDKNLSDDPDDEYGWDSGNPERALAIDFASKRAYVPSAGRAQVWVVDLEKLAAIDTDGDASNGVTPITFVDDTVEEPGETGESDEGEEDEEDEEPAVNRYLRPTAVAVSPDGAHLYVSFGYTDNDTVKDITVISTATFQQVGTLEATEEETTSGPNLHFGPDGRLYSPRVGYSSGSDDDQERNFGICIFTLGEPATETRVAVLGSNRIGEDDIWSTNDDIWDIEFIPGTTLAWASMADYGDVFVFDWSTNLPVDADGDESNGHTNIRTGIDRTYGSGLVSTPF